MPRALARCRSEPAHDRHYTPEELGREWHLSANTIRRMFLKETGVLIIKRPEKMNKRGYTTMRIPAAVADRVRARYSK